MNDLIASAAARSRARAERFHAEGLWRTEPIDLVRDAATRNPERTALAERGRSLTYRELDAAVDGAVARLQSDGVVPGAPVLFVAGNDIESIVALHGAVAAGALTMVVPPSAGDAQLRDIVAMTAPVLTIAPADVLPAAGTDGGPTRWRPVHGFGGEPSTRQAPRAPRDPDEPSMVIFTSGTTARPKGVVHSLNTIAMASRNYVAAAGLTPDDNLFVISPLASVTGMMQAIAVAPLAGAQLTIERRFDDHATFDLLLETGGTFFGGPDVLLDRVLAEAARRGVGEIPLRLVYLGGSMLDPRILRRAEREYGITVLRAYGSSEAPLSTSGSFDDAEATRLGDDGRPLAGVEIAIGSEADPAECRIRGAHLCLGYVDAEDDARAFDADGWFLTGDLGELHDGRLRISGRIKDVVIRNGMKIPITEVDGLVGALPGVIQCAGYGVVDDATGERLAMAVRLQPGAELAFDGMVEALAGAGTAKWKIPEELVYWDDRFPETPSGKVQRAQLEAEGVRRRRSVAARLLR